MRLLLDTHIALWAITDDPRLSALARGWIGDPRNLVVVSTVSLWEIAIKHALARGDMPISSQEALEYFEASGYSLLSVRPEHAVHVEQLPPIHQDPFDRMLVAQARIETLRLLSRDPWLARYGDNIALV